MRKLGCAVVVLAVVLSVGALGVRLAHRSESPAPAPAVGPRPAEIARPASRGRPPTAPDPDWLARARTLLGPSARQQSCGPYPLYTDVTEARLLDACARLASEIDRLYEERYGLRPQGKPAEAIVLFSEIGGYRDFARESGVALGYAGYAMGARGLAVFYAASESFLTTLTHELTHLVSRRALGVNLPPWLSEGLSDGIGDTATEEGFQPLVGVTGSEVQADRLRQAYASGRAGSLARLVALKRSEFDRGTVSFDYEQSAMLVRFFLSDPELAAGFRQFLQGLAYGEGAAPERLTSVLELGWDDLDRRFETWTDRQRPASGR